MTVSKSCKKIYTYYVWYLKKHVTTNKANISFLKKAG